MCGAFENVDRLKKHVGDVGGPGAFGGANLIKADAHKKFLICSSLEHQQNPSYVLNKIEEITSKYMQTLKFHTEEFNENKSKRQQGQTGLSQREKVKKISSRKQLLDKKFEEDSTKGSESGDVSRNADVRNQAVAVVSIIEDTTAPVLNGVEDPEPIVIVWGCFKDEAQAKHYIYNTASKYVRDVMLDVVNMYEWVFPTELSKRVDELDEEFRNPSLSKVMKSRKAQKKSVLSYSEWCAQEGQEPSSLEISAIKETADSEVKTEVKKTEDFKISVAVKDKDNVSAPTSDEKHGGDGNGNGNGNESASTWKQVEQVKPSGQAELFKDVTFKSEDKKSDSDVKAPEPVPVPDQVQVPDTTVTTSSSTETPMTALTETTTSNPNLNEPKSKGRGRPKKSSMNENVSGAVSNPRKRA